MNHDDYLRVVIAWMHTTNSGHRFFKVKVKMP